MRRINGQRCRIYGFTSRGSHHGGEARLGSGEGFIFLYIHRDLSKQQMMNSLLGPGLHYVEYLV